MKTVRSPENLAPIYKSARIYIISFYSSLISQENPSKSWNEKLHYRLQNSPLLVAIPSQMNPIHIFHPYFYKINFNIIVRSFRVVSCLQSVQYNSILLNKTRYRSEDFNLSSHEHKMARYSIFNLIGRS